MDNGDGPDCDFTRRGDSPTAPLPLCAVRAPGPAPQCPVCGSDLVYPTTWRQVESSTWAISLRCPDCESDLTVTLDREGMHAFNVLLFRRSEQLAREIERLGRLRRVEDDERVTSFMLALRRNLILPMDF